MKLHFYWIVRRQVSEVELGLRFYWHIEGSQRIKGFSIQLLILVLGVESTESII